MNWNEQTPINIANLNDLENRIATANSAVTTGKQNIYDAIAGKGITPGSQAFNELVAAIQTATLVNTADATAIAAQILSGSIVYVDGSKIIGTMPNRAGDTAALASSISGTTLKLRASNGYRDGVDDNVTISSADWIEANIVKNKNVLGKIGTAFTVATVSPGEDNVYVDDVKVIGWNAYNVWTKLKEARINVSGSVRVHFQLSSESSDPNYGIAAQIYKNGVPYGTERTGQQYSTLIYDEDLAFNAGDLIQIYGKFYTYQYGEVDISMFRIKINGPAIGICSAP